MRHEQIPHPIEHHIQDAFAAEGTVYAFSPARLRARVSLFQGCFPGLVTYAVKANDHPLVLQTLVDAGMQAFDVASVAEMQRVREVNPTAVLHYHNPVRSRQEIECAKEFGVRSYSIDDKTELDKLGDLPKGSEIAVRFKLPMQGAAYDFGEKFGTTPDVAAELLQIVAARGYVPCLTFHPGTQCTDHTAWARHIKAAVQICEAAGVRIARLNVGGGFAADRGVVYPDLSPVFAEIAQAKDRYFGTEAPELVCEPGRSMVSDSFSVMLSVKAVRPNGAVILNDGIYGALAEWRDMAAIGTRLIRVYDRHGVQRKDELRPRVVFGPTCDSLDRVTQPMALPKSIAEGDMIVVDGMGAYSMSLACEFNGYGAIHVIKLEEF